ncbi:MAG: hypothetical protein R3B12_02200 [Candidatus Saccharimonadales bacterium]
MSFNFYAKLSAIHAQEPLSGHTLLLDGDGSDQAAQAVIEHSRNTFCNKVCGNQRNRQRRNQSQQEQSQSDKLENEKQQSSRRLKTN